VEVIYFANKKGDTFEIGFTGDVKFSETTFPLCSTCHSAIVNTGAS
jgi:hypothetical protein